MHTLPNSDNFLLTLKFRASGTPEERKKYIVLIKEYGRNVLKTATYAPSSGLWFCDGKCINPMAYSEVDCLNTEEFEKFINNF